MSKLSEHHMQQKQEEFELEWSYQEWLLENVQEPSEEELDEMEQDFITKPHFVSNCIITYKSLNNSNYNPIGEQL